MPEIINPLVLLIIFITIVILYVNITKDSFGRAIYTTTLIGSNNPSDNSSPINGIVVFNSSKHTAAVLFGSTIVGGVYLNYNGIDLGEFSNGNNIIGVILPINRIGSLNKTPPYASTMSNITCWNPNTLKVSGAYWKGSQYIGIGVPTRYTLPNVNFEDKLFITSKRVAINTNVVNIEFNESLSTKTPYSANKNLGRWIRKVPTNIITGLPIPFGEIFITNEEDAYGWHTSNIITNCQGTGKRLKNIDTLMNTGVSEPAPCSIM